MKLNSCKPGIEVHRMGYRALIKELGVAGFISFIREFDKGYGNYVVDREAWQSEYTVDKIVEEIKSRNKE